MKPLETRFQGIINEISFSRFLEKVDSKIWHVHLLIYNSRSSWELMIAEGNKQKRQNNV
jgi:hypothetical protein